MKFLILLLLFSTQALAGYSPATILTDPSGANQMAVKAASTAPAASDPAGVVAISPNGNSVAVSSSALPSGAATSALQSTISGQLPASLGQKLMASSLSCALASDQSALPVTGTFWQATQPVSGTFWQATQPVSGTFWQATQPVSIAAAVQTKAPINANASLASTQTVTTTETNLSAPANTVGVIVECESANLDNLRWGFSNAATAILSSSTGMLCEPGRDTGVLPFGAGTVLHMIATGSAGTDLIDVQWVLSQ